MSKRGTSLVVRLTSFALLGVLGISGLAACDPGPAPQSPIRVDFAPEGRPRRAGTCSTPARRTTRRPSGAGSTRPPPRRCRSSATPGTATLVADQRLDTLHPHAVHRRHRRRRQARPLGSGRPERHLRRDRRRRRRGHRHRQHAPLTVESTNLVNNFTAGSANKIATVTGRIQVTDGKVTLDAAGGTNTKLDYVDIVPVTERARRRRHAGPHQLRADRCTGAPPLHERHRRRLHGDPRLRLDQPDRRNAR